MSVRMCVSECEGVCVCERECVCVCVRVNVCVYGVPTPPKRNVRDEARKERIKTELSKITTIPPNVYLPTAPEARVVGIHYDSGIPLQSAAKVTDEGEGGGGS